MVNRRTPLFRSLAVKVGAVIVLAEVFVLLATGLIYVRNFSDEVDARQIDRVQLPGSLMNKGVLTYDAVSDASTMHDVVGEELLNAMVIGANGVVFFSLDPDKLGQPVGDVLNVDGSLFTSSTTEPVILKDSGRIASISPIFAADGRTVRFLSYVEADTSSGFEQKRNIVRLFVLGSLATVIATSAIINLTFNFTILRPVHGLLQVLKQAEGGDLSVRVRGSISRDEIGTVQQGVNAMISQLQETVNSLEDRVKERTRDLEEARDRAEQADQVKSSFLASMSHELRTPLNSVINFTKFVARGVMGPVNERQEETLKKVIDSGHHLLNLINDVLDMSKIESGRLNLFIEDEIDVTEVVDSALASASSLLAEKLEVKLLSEVENPLPKIRGDRKRILQIMLNIVSNACKFTEQGYVKVRVWTADEMIQVAVEDTGAGIAPEDHDAVFQPFKQTSTGLRQGGGTGLGMPITKSLVEAHGGRLWFESAPDQGSTFYVALPLSSEQLEAAVVLAEGAV